MITFPKVSRAAFVAGLASILVAWPVACGGHATGRPGSTSKDANVGAIVQTSAPLRGILPHPAFAHAGANAGVTIADIAERVAPSVVNVASSRKVETAREQAPFFFDDPFFRQFFGPGMGPQEPKERREHGLGSGVIVSPDGIVLTNNHVVDGADEIKVTGSDKREYPAKILGRDEKSDLAVLKLQGASGLPALSFGDSARLRLGDVVLAIGNPFGVGETITMGIVSAKGRANVGIAAYEDFIQTDAAINPGNSGGALVDMEGHLVGINTAILSRTGGSMGIGFAIPSNMAQPIMKALIEHGKVVRGWLGVGIQDIDQDLASAMKLKNVSGVVISEVMDNGPGAKAGLKSGDIVLKMNGTEVNSTGAFRNAVAAAGVGATVKLDLLRDGKPMTLEAKLGELPPEKAEAKAGPSGSREPGALDGLTLEDLGAQYRRRLRVPDSVKGGAVVTGIEPGSAASESGLMPGDVVLEVDHVKITDAAGFKQAYAKSKDRSLLRVLREGRTLFLVLKR